MGGSPPLTRGKATAQMMLVQSIGITPAYAGKRVLGFMPPSAAKDHPRLRGEKLDHRFCLQGNPGSPPLTRGKVIDSIISIYKHRITPAYAGKSKNIRLRGAER